MVRLVEDMSQTRPIRHGGRRGNTSQRSIVPSANDGENNSQRSIDQFTSTNSGTTPASGNSGATPANTNSGTTPSNTNSGVAKQRGRKRKAKTELKMPPRSGRLLLELGPDKQFLYDSISKLPYTYPAQLGVILKHEYPGLVKEKDMDDNIIATRPAISWDDYYLSPNDEGIIPADRVKREFWHLFEVRDNDKEVANTLLESYCVDRVRQMMYAARVYAVKEYYRKKGEDLDDTLACPLTLEYEQYLEGMVWWCKVDAWRHLCRKWSSDGFLKQRKSAQEACFKSEDVAQNRGGSRPFTTTQLYLEHAHGPENATALKTYAAMKSGVKNVDINGKCGPIKSQKAQKRYDDYSVAASVKNPDNWEQLPFGPAILYDINGGLPHGRVPMGGGAVSKVAVLSNAKSRIIRASNSSSHRHVMHENQELHEELAYNHQLLLILFERRGEKPPPRRRCGDSDTPEQERPETSSSPMVSPSDDVDEAAENINVDGHDSSANEGGEAGVSTYT